MLTTLVEYTLVAADLNGDEAASINYGDNFYLDMYVQDTRTVKPDGVFAAYADLLYDDARVALDGAIQRGPEYPNVPSGNTSVPGLVDELGSVAGMNELGDSRFLLARLPMVATGAGTVVFSTNQADNLPSNDTLLYDANPSTVPPSQIAYGSTSMEILNPVFILDNGDPGFTATSGFNPYNQSGYQGDIHYANIGSLQTAAWSFTGLTRGEYQVWTNWTVAAARPTDAPYTIKNVDGVQAVVPINQKQAPDDLQDAGVAWENLGAYRVPDGDLTVELSNQASGKWVIGDAVRIQKVADIPVAIDDVGSTTSDAAAVINVLLNDEPAAGTTLQLTSVSSATNGTVVKNQDDTATYTPGSSFVGTDTFTYVLTDSNGKTDVGQVTMTVTEPPPGSEAVDDAVHTTMITAITVPVLQNDTAAQGAMLTVGTLGNPAHGLVVKNSDNTITYTPEAGFHGTDQFDYQLVDSLGETDSGQVTVSVTPVIQTRLQPSNAAGSLVTAVNAGEDFYLDVYIQDQRPQADGVFAAYFDVVMDTGLVSLDGSPVFGDSYPNTQHFTESAGQMEEIGAIGDVAFLGNAERLLFRLPVTAAGSGTADFSINPAENVGHEMLVYGSNSPVSTDTVVYDSTSLLIKEPVFIMDDGDNGFTASSGFYTWNQDGRDGDLRYADTGGNDTASWKFTQLAMGEYQAWATWTVASSRPSDASYTVSDADDVLGTVAINQKQLPNDLDSEGSLWESLGTYDIVDGTLEVGLSNNGSRWSIADAIRIEKIADIIPAPEIQVALGGTDVVDGSTLDLGSTVEGSAVTHTFTVKNSGTDTLTLSSIAGGSLPAGLVLASNLGELSLDPQETTTFAVTVTAADVATLGATIQIDNNDSDENPFDITLAAVVEALPQFQIMDDGDNGFTASSGFYTWNQDGRDGDLRYADTGGNDTASWKFTQLAMGEYQAWATWTVASSRPSDASYTVSDADDVLGTVAINQKQLPNDLDSEGSLWESLGTYDIVDGTLEVGLSNNGSRWSIADAIRIEKIADIIPAPEIQVALGGTDVVDGSTLDLGSTVEGSAVTHTFTVKNSGTDTLTLSSIAGGSLPAGLVLASNLGELSLDPQETTTFAVTVTAADVATLGATIQIDNNDSDENPFDITLAAVVEALPQFQIMDDGDNGFTASSGFYTWNQDGRDGDLRYADTGGNDTASWKFTQLAMGEYQAWATWTVASSRPSDASYTVSDADDVLGTVAINQKQSPNDLDSEGSLWESLGTYDIVDGTLEVGLSNNGSRWSIADAIRIEKIADIIPAPEIQVALGGTDVVDGSTLDLGSTVEGSAVTHTFTVKNSGTDTLTLSSIAGGSLPAGLVLASNLGELSLDPQETTTFAVTVTAADVATLGATIQIDNNDSDENPFDITLAAVVEALPQFQIMDDGDNGFTASSGFYTWNQDGRDGDLRYADTGGNDTASWKFTQLAMGEYQAWATWTVASSRPSDASYTVSDADDVLGTVAINQKQSPNDLDSEGSLWESLGTYDIVDGTLEVGLSNNGSRWSIADAIRIEKIADIIPAPEIQVALGGTDVVDGSTLDLGSTVEGSAVTHTFTVKNSGTDTLTLSSIAGGSLPAGLVLASNLGELSLDPQETTTFAVTVTAADVATLGATIQIDNNDSDENPFDITLAAVVEALPQFQIMDDGDNGFTASSGFYTWNQDGRDGDLRYADTGGNDTASWKFTQLAMGEYQAWATWTVASSRPSDASYTVSDADDVLGTVAINQKQLPNDLDSEGSLWESLGTYDIVDGTLEVGLSNNGSRWSIADAIRIEKIADIIPAPEIQVTYGGGTEVSDGGEVDLGTIDTGSTHQVTFVIENVGTDDLTVTQLSGGDLPTGFTIVTNIGTGTLAAQATTQFVLGVDTSQEAVFNGQASFVNNDSDENPFNFVLKATVADVPFTKLIDNGDAGFTATSGWSNWSQSGHAGDLHYITNGTGSENARWTVDNLETGDYRVYATWTVASSRPSDAPYTVYNGAQQLSTVDVNQKVLPNDAVIEQVSWKNLGTFTITNGTLTVELTDDASSRWLIADAIYIEEVL